MGNILYPLVSSKELNGLFGLGFNVNWDYPVSSDTHFSAQQEGIIRIMDESFRVPSIVYVIDSMVSDGNFRVSNICNSIVELSEVSPNYPFYHQVGNWEQALKKFIKGEFEHETYHRVVIASVSLAPVFRGAHKRILTEMLSPCKIQ
jgi:hypothetical protein